MFCRVNAAEHDRNKGFVPTYELVSDQIARKASEKVLARGIGAGMAMRRDVALAFGGFDEGLGPGSKFMDCEDGDLAVRHLINGWWIYETAAVAVVHDGFRTWEQGRELTRRNWIGIGAAYAKPLRAGYWQYLPVVLYEGIYHALFKPLARLLLLKRPQGLAQVFYFWRGFFSGLRTPLDHQKLIYAINE
jgi:GT2 family glycosyltransferase